MSNGKVLALYMTMPDVIRSGHRMSCADFDCDMDGIIEDITYNTSEKRVMLLTCQTSYDIVEKADLVIDYGVLLENIHVDIDLYHLKVGDVIEVGEVLLQITEPCEIYGYLRALDPEIPELLKNKRGFFVRPLDFGKIALGDMVKAHQ